MPRSPLVFSLLFFLLIGSSAAPLPGAILQPDQTKYRIGEEVHSLLRVDWDKKRFNRPSLFGSGGGRRAKAAEESSEEAGPHLCCLCRFRSFPKPPEAGGGNRSSL